MSTREQQKSKYWPTAKAYALDLPADGEPWPTRCWCGAPVQPSESLDHRCRQCATHCEIAAYRAGTRTRKVGS